ncbi:MAG TPA: hypothetical protein VMM76_05575 [Pirellulaceae bacterium]|nr:hypothetical protein [Pirellulaceae bacterium]
MSRKFLRVAKVGGSLFDFAHLPVVLRSWLDGQPGVNVLIGGGGPFVEAVRRADEVFTLGESSSHWLAIEAMQVSSELLRALLPEARLVHSLDDARQQLASGTMVVLNPAPALKSSDCMLPHHWDVTSDSIAAYVASELQADELVLFKSTLLPANTTRLQAAEARLVDGHFVHAAAKLPTVRWVNLRDTPVSERPL